MTGLERLKQAINVIRPLLIKGSINERTVENLKHFLDGLIPFFSSPILEIGFSEIQRVTINKKLFGDVNKRIEHINFLKYPQPELVKKYGRANNIGQSILYATFSPITALNEMKPVVGDIITISTWTLPDDIKLSISPICKITTKDNLVYNELSIRFSIAYEKSLHQHPKEVAAQIDELLQFVSECFAKDVEYGNNYDYFLSAYFANKVFNAAASSGAQAVQRD